MNKACDCPLCRGVPTADPDHGYDRALVPAALCLACKEPIGDEPYTLIATQARFGAMGVAHARCMSGDDRNTRALARHAAKTRAHVATVGSAVRTAALPDVPDAEPAPAAVRTADPTRRALQQRPKMIVRVRRDQRGIHLGGAQYPGRRGRIVRAHTLCGAPTGYWVVYLYPTTRALARHDVLMRPEQLQPEAACDYWPDGLEAGQ